MRLKVLTILLAFPFLASAQYSEIMSSDRPGQSITPNTVGKNVLQIQGGYVYDSYETHWSQQRGLGDYEHSNMSNYGNLNVRYGVFDKTEISGELSYGESSITNIYSSADQRDLDYSEEIMEIGFAIRQNFLNQDQHGVSLALSANYFHDRYSIDNLSFIVAASREFFDKLSATANFGYYYSESSFADHLYFTANVAYKVTDDLGVYVEYYPEFGQNHLENSDNIEHLNSTLNSGLFYQITPNIMVDASGGYVFYDMYNNNNVDVSNYSLQIGFTSRLDWHK